MLNTNLWLDMTSGLKMLIPILAFLSWISLSRSSSLTPMTRAMYDSISNLMGEEKYPEMWWLERAECLDRLSPNMNSIMEKAWEGLVEFWESRGQEGDPWPTCKNQKEWFESNCTSQPGVNMDIWEPCNYASNLAYDRSVTCYSNVERKYFLSFQACGRDMSAKGLDIS